jgi:hypothetical protein
MVKCVKKGGVIMNKSKRLTVEEAAKLLGANAQFVRTGLQQSVFPWGYAVKTSSHYTYFILTKKFEECTGIKVVSN